MNMFVRIIITYLIREFIFNKPTLAPFPQKSYLTSGTWVVAVPDGFIERLARCFPLELLWFLSLDFMLKNLPPKMERER